MNHITNTGPFAGRMIPESTATKGAALCGALALAAWATPSLGGTKLILADNTAQTLWLMNDANSNGVIDEPTEVTTFFSGANAAGTPATANPNGLGIRRDGLVAVADFTNRRILLLKDGNGDGDAQDAGESRIFATGNTGTWTNFNSPFGVTFDACGRLLVTNAGIAAIPFDGIFRLQDLNGDGDAEDATPAPELTDYCTAAPMGPGNTNSSPGEIVNLSGAIFLRDSAGTNQGVTRAVDLNADSDANDAGEFGSFFNASNAGAILLGAGFSIDIDTKNAGAVYIQNTVSVPAASTDQLIRVKDSNGDNDADDAGEAIVAYTTSEAGFNIGDFFSQPNGSLLLADSSSRRIYSFVDGNNDGIFDPANTERSVFYNNTSGVVLGVRRMVRVNDACPADLDNDGDLVLGVPDGGVDINDLIFFLGAFEAGTAAADLDNDGEPSVGVQDCGVDVNDLLYFLARFEGGC
jgi:hypothetical protein